jgi:hypothetical protein
VPRWTGNGRSLMPRYRDGHWRERRWPWITAGYVVLFAVVAAVTAFVYDSAAPANRAVVIRLAVAFVAGVLLIHIRSYFRGDPQWRSLGDPASAFEDALMHRAVPSKLDPGFIKLREEVANGTASRSFFDKILWPRLCALTRARGHQSDMKLPGERVWSARGPSRRTIAALIDHIEGPRTNQG